MKPRTPKAPQRGAATITIGRVAFAKVSAVEGIRTTPAMDADFRDFDRKGLSADERRRIISRKYAKAR